MNRTERLLDLIAYLLNSKEPVSWRKIKNHFPDDYARGVEESNQRKFERDKAELISLGIPIDYQSGSEGQKEGYIISKEKLFLPEIQFDVRESSLLMLSAEAMLKNENFPYQAQLESALYKIISLQDQMGPTPRELQISYGTEAPQPQTGSIINRIQDALDRRKMLTLRYFAFSTGETTERKVNPYGLIFRKGKWTLVGWDHLRKDLRSFVVNRIEQLEVNLRRPGTPDFEIPADFSLQRYRNQQTWELGFHDPVKVVIEVSRHRIPELLPALTNAARISDVRFELDVSNTSGFIFWILAQKTDVSVVEPKEIKDLIRGVLKDLV